MTRCYEKRDKNGKNNDDSNIFLLSLLCKTMMQYFKTVGTMTIRATKTTNKQ